MSIIHKKILSRVEVPRKMGIKRDEQLEKFE